MSLYKLHELKFAKLIHLLILLYEFIMSLRICEIS